MSLRSIIQLSLLLFLMVSCKKSAFLDTLPDRSQSVPSTISDLQALLDDDRVMNGYGDSGYPSLPEISSDDYYCTDDQYNIYTPVDQQAAIWARNIPTAGGLSDWNIPYRVILVANTVLEGVTRLSKINTSPALNSLKGQALFFRAFALYHLSQVFAPAYDSGRAAIDLGVPLRMTSDINEKITRSTLQQTYDRMIADLTSAKTLLSPDSNWLPTRASQAAVYGLLSRIYLSARDYNMALQYANAALQLKHDLMIYDTVPDALFPFKRWNPEVILSVAYRSSGPSATFRSHVDSQLFASYHPDDLRKRLFFKYGDYFFGRYDEDGFSFAGITTAEMLLTRSECLARTGDIPSAMTALNQLLEKRWAAGTFIPYTAADADDALQQILQERRKELLFRGTRWVDLRRLNKDPKTAHTLTRTIHGEIYTLPPNDPRWVMPIPDDVISFNPQMPQNNR